MVSIMISGERRFTMSAHLKLLTIPTVLLAILVTVASVAGLFVPNFYEGSVPPTIILGAYSQDVVSLLVALALIPVMRLAQRGSLRVQIFWAGLLLYLIYSYGIYAFDGVYTSMLLVYVAVLGLSTYTFIALLLTFDAEQIKAAVAARLPARGISLFLTTLVLLLIPYLPRLLPAMTTHSRLDTNAVFVFDLAFVIPAAYITAIWLWQGRTWGYVMAGIMLIFAAVLMASVILGTFFQIAQNQAVEWDVMGFLFCYGIVSAILGGIYMMCLRQA